MKVTVKLSMQADDSLTSDQVEDDVKSFFPGFEIESVTIDRTVAK